MRARLLPALAVGAALWVVAVSAVAAGLSALGWWSPWLAWPVAVAVAVGCWWCVRLLPGVRMPVAASRRGSTCSEWVAPAHTVKPAATATSATDAATGIRTPGSRRTHHQHLSLIHI